MGNWIKWIGTIWWANEKESTKIRVSNVRRKKKVAILLKIVDLITISHTQQKKLILYENSNRILMEIIHLAKLDRTMYIRTLYTLQCILWWKLNDNHCFHQPSKQLSSSLPSSSTSLTHCCRSAYYYFCCYYSKCQSIFYDQIYMYILCTGIICTAYTSFYQIKLND